MYPHRIRLRGPWQCEPFERSSGEPDHPLSANVGTRFRRRFGYPGRIDEYERVWLTFAGIKGSTVAQLNGQLLGRFGETNVPVEFDVTTILKPRNELVVDVERPAGGEGAFGDIALEVRCTAFLRKVRFQWLSDGDSVRLQVNGDAVGTCSRPLELYAIAGRSTVAYATIEPTLAGQAFELIGEPISQERDCEVPVRVDLVNGACVWFTVEVCLEDPRHQSAGTNQDPSEPSGEV